MCGISGIFNHRGSQSPVAEAELLATRDAMVNRGPDGTGLWLSKNKQIGLCHRRLAIIDLSESGQQPMATSDRRFRVTFNGEIYNHKALRIELESLGSVFRTDSDTEVLLEGWRHWGIECAVRLRGMFAFALWDAELQTLWLGRDPFGIKPLYVAQLGEGLAFWGRHW